ncbi:MAG: galactokinase [Butyricicoccus sp.]|nr:galactokinase [Butyricicoccus sp.]
MSSCKEILQKLRAGDCDGALGALYTDVDAARKRAAHVTEAFIGKFGNAPDAALFSGPGRTEIGGNHTDHQRGHVLCGSVDLDILSCAAPNGTGTVRVISEGYPMVEISLDGLEIKEGEKNTSAALVRGVAARLAELGYALSGFDAYAVSDVLSGSGLSSSAAYEVLIGNIFNRFFCGGALDAVEIAKAGQYAENVYFGKPCGLMDQMGASVGGAVAIDFFDTADPAVERVEYDFSRSGHALCIIDTGSCHADLTDDYADITREMGSVAAYFGKNVLREVPEEAFMESFSAVRAKCGDRAVIRAMHYFADDARAVAEAGALMDGDFERFLALVKESGFSSALLLQNIWSPAAPGEQAVSVALAVGKRLLNGRGAIRVHGGGFAGTVQAFVPDDLLESFKAGMEAVFGQGKCYVLHIRSKGGCVVLE